MALPDIAFDIALDIFPPSSRHLPTIISLDYHLNLGKRSDCNSVRCFLFPLTPPFIAALLCVGNVLVLSPRFQHIRQLHIKQHRLAVSELISTE